MKKHVDFCVNVDNIKNSRKSIAAFKLLDYGESRKIIMTYHQVYKFASLKSPFHLSYFVSV